MKRRDWGTNCARECEVHSPRVNENTNLVVREAKLLSPTEIDEDGDRS